MVWFTRLLVRELGLSITILPDGFIVICGKECRNEHVYTLTHAGGVFM